MTPTEQISSREPASPEGAKQLAAALLSERGEASGAMIARELHRTMQTLDAAGRHGFQNYLAAAFQPDPTTLRDAAKRYLADSTAEAAAALAQAADPPRQEVLRRMNMAPGGTAVLIAMRSEITPHLKSDPDLKLLDADLKHLFASWFNRGFLELRRIDWQSPAAVLEKLIAHEAVHEIKGWDDLRRRLAPDRRCFAFFHPALPGEPLIFVEVALVEGLATALAPLLLPDTDEDTARTRGARADTAIFYSISNCQDGLRGVSFGNFLIKQVVEELQTEFPQLQRFSTLSPIPGFRRWLGQGSASGHDAAAMLRDIDSEDWWRDAAKSEALRPVLMKLCAQYLTRSPASGNRIDPVARFHLGNGARLERINWLGNTAGRAMQESFGIMVNYLYDHDSIERNHEAFARVGEIVRSPQVDALL
ncbi:malonyl-CoA decarboxylase [Bradyrhizobium sp. LTSPM299]|uniref:malonyl-CoA decarboxylase n=1 Tax=Bradyrhizobium sp. LTSPM299 TaxID=1619233 RepID=UPI0005C97879|nr:malonyl-CoA decarboxylase [Bradyrhizobium sp. LTSPM299]